MELKPIKYGAYDNVPTINKNFLALQDELAAPKYVLEASGDAQITATEPYGATATISATNLDTGSFEIGKDYYIFVSTANNLTNYHISLNKGFDTGNLIGGFHYGKCRRVNDALVPINAAGVARGTNWESNIYNGILPRSVWTLAHRPKCSPEGMVYLGSNIWVDIYLASDTSTGGLASAYNKVPLTGTEGLNWYDFNERALVSGKRLLSHGEWLQMAMGSPGGLDDSNDNAWTKKTNGGRNNTGLVERAVSSIGCMDAVGNVWEWCDELITRAEHAVISGSGTFGAHDGARGGKTYSSGNGHYNTTTPAGSAALGRWGWDTVSPFPEGYGNIHQYYDYSLVALLAGGGWNDGAQAGARAVYVSNYPWRVSTSVGSRCACDGL